mmetsp:Transcript_20049/g.46693  ORF Transcript_20049/g.46693 Transcript_20049/m.46693 type:complete len:81 (-) Transcript_20049:200-442(-)
MQPISVHANPCSSQLHELHQLEPVSEPDQPLDTVSPPVRVHSPDEVMPKPLQSEESMAQLLTFQKQEQPPSFIVAQVDSS